MDLSKELEDIDVRIAEAEVERNRLVARLAGLYAERDALASAMPSTVEATGDVVGPPDLRHARRTEAVMAVLADHDRTLGPMAVFEEMKRRGQRDLTYEVVVSTLQHLTRDGRIHRLGHGQYASSETAFRSGGAP